MVFFALLPSALCEKEKIIRARGSPDDHNTNPIVVREQRTILEGTATLLIESGAPADFWGEAEQHLVFTMNNIATQIKDGESWSPRDLLEGTRRPFRIKYLQAFGTACFCFLPKKRREGGKALTSERVSVVQLLVTLTTWMPTVFGTLVLKV